MKFKKVAIIGMGLIGGSIGKALIKKGLADEVIGVCRRQSSLDRAVKEKSLTKGFVNSYEEALDGAELIIIATPVHTIKEVLDNLAVSLKDKDVLVTDAGSTKKEIVEYASKYADKFTFVGSHPLAGSEKAGVEYSTADLFQGSVCVVTTTDQTAAEAAEQVKGLWESLGAATVNMSPDEHDKNLAFASHLPHVAAYALAGSLGEDFPKELLSTGFKDTTRIAASDPGLWTDIFKTNRENVLKAIERYREILSDIENDISKGSGEDLKKKLQDCKKVRDDIA